MPQPVQLSAPPRRPNLLFFFTDQQRWDTAGCYGNPLGLTPTLDALAAEGVVFENAMTCQPVCGPARACLQTGRYATSNGVWRNGLGLAEGQQTVAHLAAAAGYATAYIGKWHLAPGDLVGPVPRAQRGGWGHWVASNLLEFSGQPHGGRLWDGEDRPVDYTGYRADAVTDHALDFLDRHDPARPFFMIVSHLEPHHQNDQGRYVAPPGYAERYRDYPVPGDLAGQPGDWADCLPDYYGICRRLDENLARVVQRLESRGLRENTIVFFCSDHGSHFRTRNNEYKRSPHEASIHVPLVVAGPGFAGGRRVRELVNLVDLPATWAHLTTGTVPADMEGHSLLPLAAGDAAGWPASAFVQISEEMLGRAVRTARWKYAVHAPQHDPLLASAAEVYYDACLYDLECDPHERHNLIHEPAGRAVLPELRRLLLGWIERIEHRTPAILDAPPASASSLG